MGHRRQRYYSVSARGQRYVRIAEAPRTLMRTGRCGVSPMQVSRECAEVPEVLSMRVSAAVYVRGMVHRVQGRSAYRDGRGTRRFEGRLLSGEPGPRHSSETYDYSRPDDCE